MRDRTGKPCRSEDKCESSSPAEPSSDHPQALVFWLDGCLSFDQISPCRKESMNNKEEESEMFGVVFQNKTKQLFIGKFWILPSHAMQ